MKSSKIHIEEENTQIIWGLVAVVSIGLATYVLINAFMAASWHWAGYKQLLSMALFIIGFYGIIRVSTPLFQFVLRIRGNILEIEIWRESDRPLSVKTFPLDEIAELRIAPHNPRNSKEALFDFSTNYHLLFRTVDNDEFVRLIKLEGESFTLKVDDIKRIIQFLRNHQNSIKVPSEPTLFLEA